MLKELWENVQTLTEAEYDDRLHESVLDAATCLRVLTEKVNLENKDISQAIKMLDAAKRGLGFVNKLPSSMKKAMHAQRVMSNLNKIRSFVNRLVKNHMDVENEEIENFDVDDYFDKDMFDPTTMDDPMSDCGDGDEFTNPISPVDDMSTPDADMSAIGTEIGDGGINRIGSNNVPYAGDETIPGNEYANMGYENEERSESEKEDAKNRELLRAMRPNKKIKPEDTKMFRDVARKAIEDEEFQMGYGKADDHMSMDAGNQANAAELGDFPEWATDPELDRGYNDEFNDEDMMMKGDREFDDSNDDSFANALAPEEGGSMATDPSDYDLGDGMDMENEEAVTGDQVVCLATDCHYVGDFDEFVNAGINPKCPECGSNRTEKFGESESNNNDNIESNSNSFLTYITKEII